MNEARANNRKVYLVHRWASAIKNTQNSPNTCNYMKAEWYCAETLLAVLTEQGAQAAAKGQPWARRLAAHREETIDSKDEELEKRKNMDRKEKAE